MATGWTQHNGKNYYYDQLGKMCHGWTEIEGETYLFDKITGVHQPGWRKENSKIYFNVNGEKYRRKIY